MTKDEALLKFNKACEAFDQACAELKEDLGLGPYGLHRVCFDKTLLEQKSPSKIDVSMNVKSFDDIHDALEIPDIKYARWPNRYTNATTEELSIPGMLFKLVTLVVPEDR